jgi:hypothetical protein
MKAAFICDLPVNGEDLDVEDFHDLVTVVVDDLGGDLAGGGNLERAALDMVLRLLGIELELAALLLSGGEHRHEILALAPSLDHRVSDAFFIEMEIADWRPKR